jgi:hypothetical protein
VYLYPSSVARLGTNVAAATNTLDNRRTAGCIVLYAVRVIKNENMGLVIPRTSCLIVKKLKVIIGHNNNNIFSSLEWRNQETYREDVMLS